MSTDQQPARRRKRRRRRKRTPLGVTAPFKNTVVTEAMRRFTTAELVALLNGRMSVSAIKVWRAGWRRAPEWFVSALADEIEREVERLTVLVAGLRLMPRRPGRAAPERFREWHRKRRGIRDGAVEPAPLAEG